MAQGKKRNASEVIGVEFTTNEGYQIITIDYVNSDKVQVMFLDEYKWTTWTQWGNLKRGNVKNPFHPSVYGVGYLGADENGKTPITRINGKNTREYECWHRMMERCYSEKCHEKHPTYKNCTVCQRWHSFSNFLEDITKIKGYELWRDNPNSKISLNKDTYYTELGIITDCKEYNLQTVRFLTIQDNTKEVNERTKGE